MIVVIQCAASKPRDAGRLTTTGGISVDLVADPMGPRAKQGRIYAHPDDPSDDGRSWREVLLDYNRAPQGNPLGLLPAYRLYENKIYGRLVERFGLESVFILSAGWGLIRADFLLPSYDITFSKGRNVEQFKRRKKSDSFYDFHQLPDDTEDEVVFFGGKDYLPLFCSLTAGINGKRTVFYNSSNVPQLNGCTVKRFVTSKRTNWHYECANAFLDDRSVLSEHL